MIAFSSIGGCLRSCPYWSPDVPYEQFHHCHDHCHIVHVGTIFYEMFLYFTFTDDDNDDGDVDQFCELASVGWKIGAKPVSVSLLPPTINDSIFFFSLARW